MNVQPPWQSSWLGPDAAGKHFTVPGVDNVPDLHGDIVSPQLVIFFNGNQFMVVGDLIRAFRQEYPEYERIYVETLPPGILVEQIERQALIMGNMRITHRPDLFTAGQNRIRQLDEQRGWFSRSRPYARNQLALMVPADNPKGIGSVQDLGHDQVQVSMPNPKIEGIGERVKHLYREAGGQGLHDKIMEEKVQNGTTFLTQIHHRQTPMRIMEGASDVGPVWKTEVLFQQQIGNPIGLVEIPETLNQVATYVVAEMEEAPHPEAAAAFFEFLTGEGGQAVYRRYGFMSPE